MFQPCKSNQEESPGYALISGDRRSSSRVHTLYKFAKVARNGDAGIWRIENISDSGLKFRTRQSVDIGERLTIFLSDTIVVRGNVAWADVDSCGVEFDSEINCEAVLRFLAEERKDDYCRPPRLPVGCRGLVYTDRGIRPVTVEDISQQGLKLSHDGFLRPPMKFRVVLEGGFQRSGIVRWSSAGQAGALLLEPIGCPELESVRLLADRHETRFGSCLRANWK